MHGLNEYGRLRRVALRHPREAFRSRDAVAAQWRALGYSGEPDFDLAIRQFDRFVEIIAEAGSVIEFLPADDRLALDGLYVRDATLVSPAGLIRCAMGKAARDHEPEVAEAYFRGQNLPIRGRINGQGRLEGGDVVWIDATTCVVGRGYRTNDEGIEQLRGLLGDGIEIVVVPLPHPDVFHLMSFFSPLDRDLALVYSPLLPVPFRDWLLDRGMDLVEVPDEEFPTMACNVLALDSRRCLMLDGNPVTRKRLEAAACKPLTYDGSEISDKGEGGPTCLTRPLSRD
jgi:N-dimethylarginine dimethylaminohydrolase